MAGTDYHLFIDGIPGESTDAHHTNEIDVVSFSWSESLATGGHSGGGGGSHLGKVAMGDLTVTAPTSKATPKLLVACASARHFPQARLSCANVGQHPADFLVITLKAVLVSALSVAGSSGTASNRPLDEISLSFDEIEISYRQQNPNGTLGSPITGAWNVRTNTGTTVPPF
jgi:type VI secretion system secreted protein Hcp